MSEGWTGYRLVPEDVLFFRDGKPATMGEDHYLRSIFLPYPSTVYGMVRTRRLIEEHCDLSKVSEAWWNDLPSGLRGEVGEWAAYGSLRLRGPWLVREKDEREKAGTGHECGDETERCEILLSSPLDLMVDAETVGPTRVVRQAARLRRLDAVGGAWSHPLAPMIPFTHDGKQWHEYSGGGKTLKTASDWFLTTRGITSWMAGKLPAPSDFVHSSSLWSIETRSGVGLQPKRRMHQDRMMYSFGFVRLQRGVSIGFELSGGILETNRYVRMGGENRLALLEEGPSASNWIKHAVDRGGHVAALLAPGIFPSGSVPQHSVSAAVVPDPVRVGGWDLARPGPKPLCRAVPTGSVYYFEDEVEQLSSLSAKSEEGFGLMLCGVRPGGE